jgi:hypothetical protein
MTIYRVNGERLTEEEWEAHLAGRDGIKRILETGQAPGMTSFQPFRSPVDNKVISNRKELAEHNRRHGVVDVGNEMKKGRADYVAELKERENVDTSVDVTDKDFINKAKEEIVQ